MITPTHSIDPKGCLYLVATPIGHLDDISLRALHILQQVDCIAAEDTRHSLKLLRHHHIENRLFALHEHNEDQASQILFNQLAAGQKIALISDAGTPLISDPGYPLVRLCHQNNIPVRPIPGPSALIAALSASGLPVHSFCFGGFLPRQSSARKARFKSIRSNQNTQIFYESSHRILSCLNDLVSILGPDRWICLARELTKQYEQIQTAPAEQILHRLQTHPKEQKGEFVLLIAPHRSEAISPEQQHMLNVLRQALPLKQAVQLAAQISGQSKNRLYRWALNNNPDTN